MGAAMKLAESMGYDMRAMAELLPWAEQGLLAAINKET